MTATSTRSKLSILSLAALFLGSSAQCSDGCVSTLSDAQGCIRECGNKDPVPAWGGAYDFSTNGSSRLWQCMPGNGKTKVFNAADPLVDLVQCCEMSDQCVQTFKEARTCARQSCIAPCVKSTAQQYLGCLVQQSQDNVCRFANLCVGQLTGNDSFDFASNLSTAADSVTSTDCSPMDPMVDSLCDISSRCCDTCTTNMSALASCLVNDFLLPLSSTAGAVQCEISSPVGGTCEISGASAVAVAREGGRVMQNEDIDLGDVNTTDCEEGLTMDFVVHNESYAVDQFMVCLGKKIGQILAKEDETNGTFSENNEGSSSAASLYIGTLALMMVVAATTLTL